jgi:hypothetical protein
VELQVLAVCLVSLVPMAMMGLVEYQVFQVHLAVMEPVGYLAFQAFLEFRVQMELVEFQEFQVLVAPLLLWLERVVSQVSVAFQVYLESLVLVGCREYQV